jgi:alpha-tubulin suppressor-like RCC1 family protein
LVEFFYFYFYFLFFIYFFKDDGSVFSFGYNGYGSLGIGSTTNQSYPQKIKFENDEKIDKIFSSCCCYGCFFYSSW